MAKAQSGDVVARGTEDVALKLASAGPRDALVDPLPTDIIPDNEEKGYHVGEVRQPAEPVLHRSGDVTFESTGDDTDSKFSGTSLADLKAAHNEREASDPAYEGVLHVPDAELGETRPAAPDTSRGARAAAREETSTRSSGSVIGKLDAESKDAAAKVAAEDKSDK